MTELTGDRKECMRMKARRKALPRDHRFVCGEMTSQKGVDSLDQDVPWAV